MLRSRVSACLLVLLGILGQACVPTSLDDSARTPPVATDALPRAGSTLACGRSLQNVVDRAEAESTVVVPACTYRETVRIDKPLGLVGQPGAEIRGSDIWVSWRREGERWISQSSLPTLAIKDAPSECGSHVNPSCLAPEQVFFDGESLERAMREPKSGQFTLDSQRHIVLADEPDGHTIEVTTRQHWVLTAADNVTIQGFRMRHAANDAQDGAIGNQSHSNWTLEDNILSDAHGAIVLVSGGSGTRVLRNHISRAGQIGIDSSASDGEVRIAGNRIDANNTSGFDWNWEAGGLKMVRQPNLTIEANEVSNNAGHGIWCDISCRDVRILNNRVYQNRGNGILFEISSQALIAGNEVWSNKGDGIAISSSQGVEVSENVLAWNARGLLVLAEKRQDAPGPASDTVVRANTIVMAESTDNDKPYALAWVDRTGGQLFDRSLNNRGLANAFWLGPRAARGHFAWSGRDYEGVIGFNTTPGGSQSLQLSDADKDQILAEHHIPATAPND